MKRFFALALVVAMIGLGVPMPAGAAVAGQISGTALTSDMQAMRAATVRLRSLTTGVVRDMTAVNAQGGFSFSGLNSGSYMVEVVDNGQVVGTSGELAITAKAPVVAGVRVMAAAKASAGARSSAAGFFSTTAGILILAGAGAGITAAVLATRGDSSPSK
jgi:hypothetical protein